MYEPYARDWFDRLAEGSRQSAEIVVPEVIRLLSPDSVVDVGCGVATWLAVFERHGVEDILGIDADHVERDQLQIDPARFEAHDLSRPVDLGRRFSLALSLEVAEHLPEAAAETFIDTLVGAAPTIVFSAAIPMQGGERHLNERPQSYWAHLFAERGFEAIDCLRPRFWRNQDVEWWYRQNAFVFSSDEAVIADPDLAPHRRDPADPMLDVVHPYGYVTKLQERKERIDTLHKVYKQRIRDAKEEVRRKLQGQSRVEAGPAGAGAAQQQDNESYGGVWDDYVKRVFPGLKERRNLRATVHAPEGGDLIRWPGDEWGFETEARAIFDATFPDLPPDKPLNLVEIGPGSGRYTRFALDTFPQARLFAFDVSQQFLDSLKERLAAESLAHRVVSTQLTEDPDLMLRALASAGVAGEVDAFFSYDAMVHVDLQTLATYLVIAGLTLREGGTITMSVADATTEEGAAMLFRSARRVYAEGGRPSVKFFWKSPEVVRDILERLGFSVRFMLEDNRDLYFEARLEDVEKAKAVAAANGFPLDRSA